MGIEADVITAILKNNDIGLAFNEGVEDLFNSHREIWEGVHDYYVKYSALPTVEWVEENYRDFEAGNVSNLTKPYIDKLRDERIKSKLRNMFLDQASKLQEVSGSQAVEEIMTNLQKINKINHATKDLNLMDFSSAKDHYDNVRRLTNLNGAPGIPTGFKTIDQMYPTGWAPGQLVYFIGYSGKGKQEWVENIIPTPKGYRRFGDITVGDYVFGRTGTPNLVTGVYPQQSRKAMKCYFNDGTEIIVGPDHLWSIYCGFKGKKRNNLVTFTTKQLLERGLINYSIGEKSFKSILPLPEPVQYDTVELPIDPYTLGVLIGDGYYGDSDKMTVISCNDIEIVENIKNRNPNLVMREYTTHTCRRWALQKMQGQINRLGWSATKCNKFIPDMYMTAHYQARLDLVRGLMDSDGYVRKNHRPVFHQKNIRVANQFAELIRSLGGVAKINERIRATGEKINVVTFWLPDNPFSLYRKAKNYTCKPWFKAFVKIESVEDCEMQCISVEAEDELYLTKDYIVTHNTWASLLSAIKAWEQGYKPMIVSLEMSPTSVRDRVYTTMGNGLFSASSLARGEISDNDFAEWSLKQEGKPDFVIISNEHVQEVTPNYIQGKIEKYEPNIVILDYIQLAMDNEHSEGMTVRMQNLSRQLKLMAGRNDLPIICISAVTDDDSTTRDDPPMISQFRWSKSLEYDSDLVLAIHKHTDSNLIEVVCRKSRHGPLFSFYLDWNIDNGIVKEIYDV